ncbi:TadE family protein [Yersinia pseudotuberculosis]|nr:TadE family protein [Yersinia pseudotuberculosis]
MRDTILRLLPANRGSIAVEFTLIFILFIFMLLLVAETSRLFYISANLDFALSEAAKTAKTAKNRDDENALSYQQLFDQNFNRQVTVMGSLINTAPSARLTVKFSHSVAELINGNSEENNHTLPLAHYQVRLNYQPIFLPFPQVWVNTLLSREVIFVQEK